VIDEISMLNQLMFEIIDFLCRKIRNCEQPFGGIQIVASGDFYQLPPVGDNDDKSPQSRFCFQSTLWEKTFEKGNSFEFDVNFRQNDDPEYFKILQEIRTGTPSFDTIGVLVNCCKKKYTEDDKSKPTILYPTKTKVEEINKRELNKLLSQQSEFREYKYHIKKDDNIIEKPKIESVKNQIDNLLKNGRFEETLKLCVGCQVMCISNIKQEIGLVNGSQGIVKRFEFGYPIVKFDNIQTEMKMKEHSWGVESEDTPEENPHTINQLPLVLSWAITIHKSQGMSIENAIVDIGNSIFQYGQTYVALSRVKSLNGLYLTKMNAQKIKAHPEVKKFYKKLKSDDEEI
jgi:ATP-dependent DNA helicase PIF1